MSLTLALTGRVEEIVERQCNRQIPVYGIAKCTGATHHRRCSGQTVLLARKHW